MPVIHVTGTIYAISHGYKNALNQDSLRLTTINVTSAGVITGITSANVSEVKSNQISSIVRVSENGHASGDAVVAIYNSRYYQDEGGSAPNIVRTWRISSAGAINGEIDSLEIGPSTAGASSNNQQLARRGTSNYYIVTLSRDSGQPWVYTFGISTNGTFEIGGVADSQLIEADQCYTPSIVNLGNNTNNFVVAYGNNSPARSILATVSVDGLGGIIGPVDTEVFERTVSSPINLLDGYNCGFNGVITSCKPEDSNTSKLTSYPITTTALISDEVDNITVNSGNGYDCASTSLTGNGILVNWKGDSNVGNFATLTMDASGNFSSVINRLAMTGAQYTYGRVLVPVNGSSNPTIYLIVYCGGDVDGWSRTFDVTSICT